jgi:hypothetical protein
MQAWWHTPIIPTLGELRKEDQKFEAGLGYIVRHCLIKTQLPRKQSSQGRGTLPPCPGLGRLSEEPPFHL